MAASLLGAVARADSCRSRASLAICRIGILVSCAEHIKLPSAIATLSIVPCTAFMPPSSRRQLRLEGLSTEPWTGIRAFFEVPKLEVQLDRAKPGQHRVLCRRSRACILLTD